MIAIAFSIEILQARREWRNIIIFINLKGEKNHNLDYSTQQGYCTELRDKEILRQAKIRVY